MTPPNSDLFTYAISGTAGLFDKSLHLKVFNVDKTEDKKMFLFSNLLSLAQFTKLFHTR